MPGLAQVAPAFNLFFTTVARPAALVRAPALLEGDQSLASDPLLTRG